jgi:hypothetical protein
MVLGDCLVCPSQIVRGKDVAEMWDRNCCFRVISGETPLFFPLFPRCYPAIIWGCFSDETPFTSERSRKQWAKTGGISGEFAAPLLALRPKPAGFRDLSAAVCCKSAAFAAKRPSPAGPNPPAQSGPAQVQSGCKSAANAARSPFRCRSSHRRPKPGSDAS